MHRPIGDRRAGALVASGLALGALALIAAAVTMAASLVLGEPAAARVNGYVCLDPPDCSPHPPPGPPSPPAPPSPTPPPPSNGACVTETDPYHGITYRCNPSRTTFMTPDNIDPATVTRGTNRTAGPGAIIPCCDSGIPGPAPYRSDRDYSSDPDFVRWGSFVISPALYWAWGQAERHVNAVAYAHDVCYGSQLGQLYCDVRWHKDGISSCKSYWWGNPLRWACYGFVRGGYEGMRLIGKGHYTKRTSSSQPTGEPW